MNPNDIHLTNLNIKFEYERFSRTIDSLEDINESKKLAKYFMKLYLQQKEVISNLGKF